MVYRDSGPSSSGTLDMKPLSYPIESKRPCPTVCVLRGRGQSLGVHVSTSELVPFFVD